MIPEKHMWVFTPDGSGRPGGVFSTREIASAWVRRNKLSGMLTAYPVDEGCYDWALRCGLVTGRAGDRGAEPAFVASFTSASQDHVHYEDGEVQ